MSVDDRWNIAKEQKLCFRCLSDGHRREACFRSRVRGIKGCRFHHHRLLHKDPKKEDNAEAAKEADLSNAVKAGATTEGESSERTLTATTRTSPVPTSEFVALRTVPVYVTIGKRRLKVNALLDDASSRTYLNGDIAAELDLEDRPHELTINVLNDNQERLDTTVVEFMISSCDGKVSKLASAYTAERVTGNMQVVDWSERIIRQAQQEVFKEERAVQAGKELPSGSKLQPLKPVLDEDGILQCDGRLRYAEFLPWETRYPIMLPRNHCVSRLIIKHAHEQSHHGGINQVLSELSTQYWLISAREAIKKWERACM